MASSVDIGNTREMYVCAVTGVLGWVYENYT